MRAELLRPGLSGGRGNRPPGCTATGGATTGAATGLALGATGFDSDLGADFGMVLITDLVSGLSGLPEVPGLAGTGLAAACLVAAGVTNLVEDFFASGFAADATFLRSAPPAADLDEAMVRPTCLAAGLAASLTVGFAADFTAGFTIDLTAGLTAGFTEDLAAGFTGDLAADLTGLLAALGAGLDLAVAFGPLEPGGFAVVPDTDFAEALAGAAGFFLTVLAAAFMTGLLSKSASHGW